MERRDLKDIVIVGYGGFAREVEWLISRINEKDKTWNFKGFIDVDTCSRTGDSGFRKA